VTARFDALSRIGPVARPLLATVDDALVRHGAPAGHPIWAHLRRLGTTPADAAAFFVDADPASLRAAADRLRAQAEAYVSKPVPTSVRWEGTVADVYAVRAAALRDHTDAMATRLTATARYAEDVASWWDESRADVAAALAEVLTSAQAVTVTTKAAPDAPAVLSAAADIGARVLAAASAALDAGHALLQGGGPELGELTYHAPADPVRRADATIDLHH
jgi:hypothetical protein